MKKKIFFIAFILLATCFQLNAQTVTWNGDGDNINWTDADNWDTDAVPVAGNDVVISVSSSQVTITGTHTVRMVTISSSADLTIASGAVLNIDGATSDHGLETTGSGNVVINNGTINIKGITTDNMDGIYSKGTFTNNGTIDINGVTGTSGDGIYVAVGNFTNSSGATITITNVGSDSIRTDDNSGTPATFSNEGTITITQTTGDDGIYVNDSSTFNNTGTITVSGTGGDMGMMIDDGGTFNNNSGGTLTINAIINDQIFLDNDGAVNNTGTINLNNSGDMGLIVTDQGVFTNNTGGIVTITDAVDDSIHIDANSNPPTTNISNSGTITTQNGSQDGLSLQEDGVFTNNSGGNLVINQPTGEGIRINASEGTLTNSGTITITGSGSGVAPGDNGIEVSGGTLTNATGATLTLTNIFDDGIYINNGTINNTGTLNVSNTGEEGLYMSTGSNFTNNSGGSLGINQPTSEGITASEGTLTNSGTITITGSGSGVAPGDNGIDVTGGTLTNASGSTLTITNIFDKGILTTGGIINNTGTIDISNTGEEAMDMATGGTFNNNNGGVFKVVDGAADALEINSGCTVINYGDMQLTFTTDGSGRDDIEFNGGTFTNNSNATFNPGNAGSKGELEFRGNIDLGTSTTTFEISGTTHTTEFDRIEFPSSGFSLTITNATAHLNWGTYVPNVGDTFKIVDGSGTVTGIFGSVTTSNSDIVTTLNYSANEVQVEVTDINSTWTGNSTTDWDTAGNWSTIVPTATTDVTIPSGLSNYPIASSAVSTNGITMTAGTSFIANSTVSGNVTYNRTLTSKAADADGWHLISSPVVGQVYNNAYATTNGLATSTTDGTRRGLATFNDANDPKFDYLLTGDSNAGTFTSGFGYSAKIASTGTIAFTGTINTSDVNGVTVSSSDSEFVLLGVPYTSYISSQTFLNDNTNLDQSQIWVWEQGTTGGNYIAATAKGDNYILAPGQGFFVKKATTGATVDFAESNQQSNADTFKKSSRTEVKLLMNDGENNRFAKLYYVNNVTKGYDTGWEGETFEGIKNNIDVFSQLVEGNQGKNYQVQSLPFSEIEYTIIPLGIRVPANKEITFSVEALNLPSGINVFLEDRAKNIFTNLNESDYNITLLETTDGVGRFFLHVSSNSVLSIDDDLALDNISIYKANASTLRIVGLQQGNASIKLYNVLGKQIMNSSFEADGVKDISLPSLAKGVYIVQLNTEAGKLNKKIVLE